MLSPVNHEFKRVSVEVFLPSYTQIPERVEGTMKEIQSAFPLCCLYEKWFLLNSMQISLRKCL